MFGTRKMIAAARTLHSSNVDELMEAFADDYREQGQPQARENIAATPVPASEPQASAGETQLSLPQKTAA